ncbi:pyruvate dehydrogenase (acetyl-transferring) E1 component subunit alpha [Streptomyces canus]|uniref:Pyruvate dehydrogenase (Acetyl-transferring) E1 component subunit alpha n=1 Tax=Streptomyces canus TaxID=58343 RepID=A0A117QWU2_9ACTN|nr:MULTISPECIES: pyruvate dehydrogenase (acetyl-transferring) E1 component subunit alpha [Streptomyces]KUN58396.1 pyruvate dehydrogenase (acetyl-transferring) E1 component subunit alpha [Streptomyces canus]MDI5907104.1 pyruvate dehydrogenase (acetyl-transferring) E1 component subunit alpha [Streptomyces sp. 12257]
MTLLDDSSTPVLVWTPGAHGPRRDPAPLLPDPEPFRMLGTEAAAELDADLLRGLYRRLVLGRRYNQQATTLTKQGRLAVYPASTGQEACEIAAATALRETDWLFPSYRDTLAAVSRGVRPVEALTLLRGDAHSGYDPYEHRVAPLSTPLATQAPHAVGLAYAAQLRGDDLVAMALVGDGGTSEGDFHEALNFAAVLNAPVVFLVQNNGYAISVPLAKQSAAPTLAHKAVGYGISGRLVDGNDAAAMHIVLSESVEHARSGCGPVLVEAVTYRLDAHTNADDATRYRSPEEVAAWQAHDPLTVLERHLREHGLLDDTGVAEAAEAAEELAAEMRAEFHTDPLPDPLSLFTHVYAEPTSQLREQAAELRAWLTADAAGAPTAVPKRRR